MGAALNASTCASKPLESSNNTRRIWDRMLFKPNSSAINTISSYEDKFSKEYKVTSELYDTDTDEHYPQASFCK
ncbi:MAG: hypothetical protein ACRCTJ_01580 [Brevinema sp.]